MAPSSAPDTRPSEPRPARDLEGWVAGAVLAVACTAIGWLRIRNRWATTFDLGVFDQGVWLMSQGRNPQLTVLDDHLFGDHLSPVLVLFAPAYRLVPSPMWMIVAQALCVGATVVPLRRLAHRMGTTPRVATLATLASAPLLAAATYDFHPVVLAVPLVAWLLVAVHDDDLRLCTWCALGICLIRADTAVVLLGAAVLASPRVRRRLVPIAVASMAISVAASLLLDSEQTFTRHWGNLGHSPADALVHPWRAVPAVLSAHTVEVLAIWLLPVGFLALLRPRWFAALLVAGAPMLLSDGVAFSLPWFHHAAPLVPFALGGALAALAHVQATYPGRRRMGLAVLASGAVLALALASPLAPRAPGSVSLADIATPRTLPDLDAALARVGPDEAVSAPNEALFFLTQRDEAYLYPCPLPDVGAEPCTPPAGSSRPDVVIAPAADADALTAAGWDVEPMPAGHYVVGRPR